MKILHLGCTLKQTNENNNPKIQRQITVTNGLKNIVM